MCYNKKNNKRGKAMIIEANEILTLDFESQKTLRNPNVQ